MKTCIHTKTGTWTLIAVVFVIATNWKPAWKSIKGEWISNLWYTYTVEYYSALKKNKLPVHNKLDECQSNCAEWNKPE